MTIVQRNFFRLLRSGAFESKENIEPMSVSKWEKVYQLAIMHDVAGYAYEGLLHCREQFFLHLTDKQWEKWETTVVEFRKRYQDENAEEDEFLRGDHLTNPLLNHKLQAILDDEHSDMQTRQFLLAIIRCSRHILNEGVPVKQLIAIGSMLRTSQHHTDMIMLERWLKSLRFQHAAQLLAALLIRLLDFKPEEIPFASPEGDKRIATIAQELIAFTNTRSQDFYFSQDSGSIFVHTSNGSAMLSHMRRSARYFRYHPSETLTNFFASFAHSLSHIEE